MNPNSPSRFVDFHFHDSDVMGLALINTASAHAAFRKLVWCVTALRIWTLLPLLNQQRELKRPEPLIPGAHCGGSACGKAPPPPPFTALPPPFMDMDGKTYRG